ncbi:MAG: hypothetical protein R2854_19185 [Caldilineaceae bacterium]
MDAVAQPWSRYGPCSGCCWVLGALAIALVVGIFGPLIALALAVAIVGGTRSSSTTHWLCGAGGRAFRAAFASLPFSIGFKLHLFLDAALLAALLRVGLQADDGTGAGSFWRRPWGCWCCSSC